MIPGMISRRGLVFVLLASLMWGGAAVGLAQNDTAEETEPEIVGVEMQRNDGRFLGLAVEGNAFVIRFYDADKKEEPIDVARATARWSSRQKAGQQRTVLNPNGGVLRSPAIVRPPLVFNVFVSFISNEGEVSESFNFNLRELSSPAPSAPEKTY
jgi:hypothetical protein